MTKYTKEQREMITEFLEKEILPLKSKVNQSLPFSALDEWVNAKDIVDKIKNLKFTRFAEIKNQMGIRFTATSVDKFSMFIVCCTHKDGNKFILNIRKGIIEPTENIADDTLVEVIND